MSVVGVWMAELVLLSLEEEEWERDAGAQQDTVGVIARLSTDMRPEHL